MNRTENLLAREAARRIGRVLVVDANPASARMVAELLKTLGVANISMQVTGAEALSACAQLEPEIIFTELAGPRLNGLEMVKTLRRSSLACRKAPVIMITAGATASAIIAARNAGVHEFLRRPFTLGDLARRLEAVTQNPRDWIEAMNYIGPDRRRFNSGDYQGPRKRLSDDPKVADADRIRQALRILRSAVEKIEDDPLQALRSMHAQAATLKACAMAVSDMKLITAVSALQRSLQAATDNGRLARRDIEAGAAGLWAFETEEPVGGDANLVEL